MTIKSLQLTNFRNWTDYTLKFSDVTILIGHNGVGKTNIVEAIWFLATGKSWRTSRDAEAVNWTTDIARIVAELTDGRKTKLEFVLQKLATRDYPQTKLIKINGSKSRLFDLLGLIPAVLFSPETIEMLDGAPGLRRRFLDILLVHTDKQYTRTLLEYNKILKERNKLLALIRNKRGKADELEFWDAKLVETGCFIIDRRVASIKFMNQYLTADYQEISGTKETLKLKYKGSVEKDVFADMLVGVREREIELGSTLYGPHRDDFTINLNDRDISTFGSRGEYRSAVLALKVAELKYLKDLRGESPILLLDDIFSELDSERRLHLAKIVHNQQTIITTTDLDHIEKGLRDKAKIVEIS